MTDVDLLKAKEEEPILASQDESPDSPDSLGELSGESNGEEARGGDGEEEAAESPEDQAKPAKLGSGEDLDDEELLRQLTALLFASPDPLSLDRLVQLLDRPQKARVTELLGTLEERLETAQLPLTLAQIAGGWRILTRPELAEVVQRLSKVRKQEKVTPAALETLAIVAYRQPVTNAEVEAIRGVQAGAMLRALVDRGLLRVTGRADQPGSPLQYGTTRDFLDKFGLESLKDLPRDGELARE